MILSLSKETKNDFTMYRAELLELHRRTIEAHLEKDVEFLVSNVSEDLMSINNGVINYPTINEMRETFQEYLDNTEFTVYRNLSEPIIGFSNDGSIAWSSVQVRVEGNTGQGNNKRKMGFTCAWITLYRRVQNSWIRFIEASSFT